MQQIIFRQLIPTDHDEYKRVRLESLKQYPDNFGTTYEEELHSGYLKLDDAIKFPGDNKFAFGAFSPEEKLIGICGFIAETRSKARHRGEITQMYVENQYTRRGIGGILLQLVINKAFDNKQIEQITLGVVYSNENAVKLYKQLGFIEYGRLENYFRSGTQYFTQSFLSLAKKAGH
jgi:ribosomal protein S18 acetylase RimI-like enzyme